LADCLQQLLREARLPVSLQQCGVQEPDLARLAAEATTQWTAQFNPRPVTAADFQALFAAALAA
jgi:alcohol dehydrogenase